MRQISLDTETTGLFYYQGHRIMELGCIEIIDREITKNKFHSYINPIVNMVRNSNIIQYS